MTSETHQSKELTETQRICQACMLSPWAKIVNASNTSKGIRLRLEEIDKLLTDEAIKARGEMDLVEGGTGRRPDDLEWM